VQRTWENERTEPSESDAQAVRAELNRLVESTAFRNSRRCGEFLQYVVEQTLGGATGALKERSIGVELFHLPQDFDSGQHTVVRVTANEVRKKLAQHYLAEIGSQHPVRIGLPAGSYCAEFKWPEPVAEARVPSRPGWHAGRALAGAAVVLAILLAVLFWRWHGAKPVFPRASSASASAAAQGALPEGEDLRIGVGGASPYLDRGGRTWGPDRFFSGGSVLTRPLERVLRTLDPDLYRRSRQGDFRYDIPLKPGSYELHLHFAETGLADSMSAESSGEGQRLFRVSANGKLILDLFDVVADSAGANISDERVFRNISPAEDGLLHLSFVSVRGTATLSGIEVLPVRSGSVRPVRIRAGWPGAWRDPSGHQWQADTYFLGGNALVRSTNPSQDTSGARDMALYASERWGHFSYALPVADGQYRVKLAFCEGRSGSHNTRVGGSGSRLFDVYCNGVALLRSLDIFKEAGGEGLPLEKTFTGIRPTAQGKIVLTFVPVVGLACVNGIEISE
jgi:hypothetical protein